MQKKQINKQPLYSFKYIVRTFRILLIANLNFIIIELDQLY